MQPGVVIQEAVPQWYQMVHDLEKVAKRLDADRWPKLQARLKNESWGLFRGWLELRRQPTLLASSLPRCMSPFSSHPLWW